MAYPSLTYRGSFVSTADQATYTFSAVDVGTPSELRAVLVLLTYTPLSGASATPAMVTGYTIGGLACEYIGAAYNVSSVLKPTLYAFIARVPSGATADIVISFNTVMTFCNIDVFTLKPESLTPVEVQTVATAGGVTDTTMSDISVVENGVVIVALTQSVTTTNTIIWTGADPVNTSLAQTNVAGVFYNTLLNIQPSSASATNDLLISSTSTRRNILAISFGVQGTIQDTLADGVGVTEEQPAQTTYSPALTDGAAFIVGIRHTPIQSLEDTLSEIIGTAVAIAPAVSLEIADFVDVSGLVGVPIEDYIYDTIDFFTELFEYGWGLAVADNTEFAENELSYYFARGVVAEERIGVAETPSLGGRYVAVVAERAGIRRVLVVALPVTVSDAVGVQYADSVVRGVRVIEGLGLSGQLLNKLTLNKAFTDSVRLSDSLLRFFSGDVVDGFAVTDLLARQRTLNPTLTDTAGVSDTLAKQLILRATAAETVQLTHTDVLNMLFRSTLADGVELAAAYISPGNSVTTWAINTKNMATTEYTNYAFNSFAQMGSKYLGATGSGLYELNGDDDQGTDIIASIKSGLMQLGGSRFTSFKTAYIGMRGEGNFVLKVETGDGKVYNYAVVGKDMQTSRVHFGKGLRARYFSFELISTGQDFDLDTVEFIPLVVQRRV